MEPDNTHTHKKIYDAKERLRIVLASLQPGVNKSELCRKEGIYIHQLIRWGHDAMKGAQEALKKRPGRNRQVHDVEKEHLKKEVEYLKELLLEQTKEISTLKKRTNTL